MFDKICQKVESINWAIYSDFGYNNIVRLANQLADKYAADLII